MSFFLRSWFSSFGPLVSRLKSELYLVLEVERDDFLTGREYPSLPKDPFRVGPSSTPLVVDSCEVGCHG